jgi:hypothetical protein
MRKYLQIADSILSWGGISVKKGSAMERIWREIFLLRETAAHWLRGLIKKTRQHDDTDYWTVTVTCAL